MSYKEKTQQYIFNNYARYPITLVRGKGTQVWDDTGKVYLDFLSGIACTPLGHCHPAITKAIIAQAQTLLHTSNLYYTPPAAELAASLVQHGGLNKVFFCNSGAEANEAAIKLARKYQYYLGKKNKHTILSAAHSFHGRTLATLAATDKAGIKEGFAPLPEGFISRDGKDAKAFCDAIDETIAAVIIEPIQGESGVHVASAAFLEQVRIACDKVGALLIFDEVQCGVGRTGHLFAYQYYAVKPDIITLAKGLANGLPIGALCATENAATGFKAGDHGSTFGGNLVSCRAAQVLLDVILQENYLPRIQSLSTSLFTQLHALQKKYPASISEIRGVGLMVGIEVQSHAREILTFCQKEGLLINLAGENVLRLLPPYIITEEEIAQAVGILERAVAQIS
jgi:acetylornithine/N-succinyldiaminopimelate aminotransferase